MNNSQSLIQNHIASNPDQLNSLTVQIVELVTGLKIEELPLEQLQDIIEQSLTIYIEFMNDYVAETFGKRAGLQLQILQSNEDMSLFNRFDGMSDYLKQAHSKFILSLQS